MDVHYLIVNQKVKNPTFIEHMRAVFEPFSNELWVLILVFLIVFGLVLGMIERGGGDFEDTKAPLTVSSYMALLGYSAGPNHAPITPGGRIVYLGFGWLICILGATYTANLASLLIIANSLEGFTSIDDLIRSDGTKLCVPSHGDAHSMLGLYPALDGRFHVSHGLAGCLMDLEAGECAGAAMGLADLEVAHSRGRHCTFAAVGAPVREVPLAFAVSEQFVGRLSSVVSMKLAENQLSHLYKHARPKPICPDRTLASSSQLGPEELAGVFVPSAAFLVVGLLVWLTGAVQQFRRTSYARRQEPIEIPVETPVETTSTTADTLDLEKERPEENLNGETNGDAAKAEADKLAGKKKKKRRSDAASGAPQLVSEMSVCPADDMASSSHPV